MCYTCFLISMRAFMEKRSKVFWGIFGVCILIITGVADHFTGYEISLTLFYLPPIAIYTWFINARLGAIMAIASALTWLSADFSGGLQYSNPNIFIWNTLIRMGFLTIISYLVSVIRKDFTANQFSARTDFVTGAVNPRYFYELAQVEIDRSQRYERPLTFAYLDLDNFKQINDSLGHSMGDDVLRSVVKGIRQQTRSMDIIARMGGDEFALLLSETGAETAIQTVNRIHQGLMKIMSRNRWQVTFSIGVVTFKKMPKTVDEMVKVADQMMYQVKISTKNDIKYLLVD